MRRRLGGSWILHFVVANQNAERRIVFSPREGSEPSERATNFYRYFDAARSEGYELADRGPRSMTFH